eukprot:CAMPEP_0177549814 /NCGR_PEP_ID=MMETSP0369-20130122/65232_1 /TAXON_ID=447022 ORGANISM="Scrippsiella hangoei-like, Strain SHHI-4" /NCGR_SAMPLE_ID=MMETSP0369 /ASSEMBLY_ACC=CAM_ASM_000364 /LENGTH=50 /DNA_ID=CAMNT_0019034959 /DNA_START=115 /DNA_END=268 /DNA_ORIENTATION=-
MIADEDKGDKGDKGADGEDADGDIDSDAGADTKTAVARLKVDSTSTGALR